jgi:hypothetical protein
VEREKTVSEQPDKTDQCQQCGACAGCPTPLSFEMGTATSAAIRSGLPQSINCTSNDATRLLQTAVKRMSNVPATVMNGALLPATTTTSMTRTAATTTAVIVAASAGTLLPNTTGVAHHVATPTFPTMAPGLLQEAPQFSIQSTFPHPVYAPFQLPTHQFPFLPQ